MLIHDTGNEPGLEEEGYGDAGDTKRRGVDFQLQGRFKQASTKGAQKGLYLGGELPELLKLGFFTRNLVGLCSKYAKAKTEGRIFLTLGDKMEKPHLGFPISQLFTCVVTPPGKQPPTLGSPELAAVKWQGAEVIDVDTESTYTFFYKTPFIDLCSWELLKIPGVSPLAIETILGDICTASVGIYDLGIAGTHANWRKGSVLRWAFSRGASGDSWMEDVGDGARTPLDDASDVSEASEGDEVDEILDMEGDQPSEASDESDSSEDPIEDEEELCKMESQTLFELDAWRPPNTIKADDAVQITIPYYIEAIERRRRRRLRVWYILALQPSGTEQIWWHAKAASELASQCRPRPRIRGFRRGSARSCYGVQVLEHVRQVALTNLSSNRNAKESILCQATTPHPSPTLEVRRESKSTGSADHRFMVEHLDTLKRKVGEPLDKLNQRVRRKKILLLPPRFFLDAGSKACELAFAHAKEGRGNVVHEGLVGAIQFEGRVCEELLRLSKDMCLRSFVPYDCERPRIKIPITHVLRVSQCTGVFLGRFYQWEVHTRLRVFVFCNASEQSCKEWIAHLEKCMSQISQKPKKCFPVSQEDALQLLDSTRARRWRPKTSLVLNDRRLLSSEETTHFPSTRSIQTMLQHALSLAQNRTDEELIHFTDSTCLLKAVRFSGWSQKELLAFWINTYHCLLIHGLLILGVPKSRRESVRFYSRVSYLVCLRPVSLKEIERHILKIPCAEPVAVAPTSDKARWLLWCLCRRRAKTSAASTSAGGDSPRGTSPERGANSATRTSSGLSGQRQAKGAVPVVYAAKCLPTMMQLPRPWRRRRNGACLFLGHLQGPLKTPQLDLRITFCLNRGNLSCLPTIPVFDSVVLDTQLEQVSCAFIAASVIVKAEEGRVTKVTLPHCCRGVRRELNPNVLNQDPQAILKFVWHFMSAHGEAPQTKVNLRFSKYQSEPRQVREFNPMVGLAAAPETVVKNTTDIVQETLSRHNAAENQGPTRSVIVRL